MAKQGSYEIVVFMTRSLKPGAQPSIAAPGHLKLFRIVDIEFLVSSTWCPDSMATPR
jgi:hypothetical protein